MKIQITLMTYEHVASVVELERACFSLPWSECMISEELDKSYTAYYVATTEDNSVIGYVGVHIFFKQGNITNLAVLPDYRSKGVGRRLISKVFKECAKAGVTTLTLEVRQSNEIAIALYRKLGFFVIGKREDYYREPIEDALLMFKNL